MGDKYNNQSIRTNDLSYQWQVQKHKRTYSTCHLSDKYNNQSICTIDWSYQWQVQKHKRTSSTCHMGDKYNNQSIWTIAMSYQWQVQKHKRTYSTCHLSDKYNNHPYMHNGLVKPVTSATAQTHIINLPHEWQVQDGVCISWRDWTLKHWADGT